MKKLLSLVAISVIAISVFAERVSETDAALVANNFMNVTSAHSALQQASARRMVLKKVANATEENLFYVYENEGGEGWVLVAADDAVTPVLAFSETGHFSTDNMPINVRRWLGKYNTFIKRVEADSLVATDEVKAEWTAMRNGVKKATQATVVVGPLVKTTWDQDSPYWDQCPGSGSTKAYTGCVATAMAQVMNYWQWPVQGTGSHSYQPLNPNTGRKSSKYSTQSADFGNTTYDWANMRNSYSGSYTTAQATAVATLMYHCGVATEMMYGDANDDGSGTYTGNYGDWEDHACAQNALWMNFGYKKSTIISYMRDGYTEEGVKYYDSWTDDDWTAMVKAELDLQHPIMYGGASDQGGHSFICDGYRSDNYFHFNWGWSGENDGYYKLSKLVPGGGGAGGGSYDFSEDQEVVIGIEPDKQDVEPFDVTLSRNGDTETIHSEDTYILPTAEADACEDWAFAGWAAKPVAETTTRPQYITKVSTAQTVYAVYKMTEIEEGGTAMQNVTVNMSDLGAINGTINGITLAAEKNNGQTTPTYNDKNYDGRVYAKGTLTVSAENEMTQIVFNISAQGKKRLATITPSVGTIATQTKGASTLTWTGSAKSVTFTVGEKADYGTEGSSKAGQLCFTSLEVLVGGDNTIITYTTAPDCDEEQEIVTPSGLEVVNGRVLSEQPIRIYNIIGQDMTAYNGSLPTGTYIVRTEKAMVKVFVR